MMKKKVMSGLLLGTLLTSGIAYATPETQDVPATLAISGTVNSTAERCEVTLSREMIVLNASVSQMIPQGSNATDPRLVSIFIDNVGQKSDSCAQAAADGKLGVKFIGDADDADGTTLANSAYVTDNGAKGVGIGIFKEDNTPIAINNETLDVTDDASGNMVFGMQLVKLTNQDVVPGDMYARLTVQVERL